MNWLKKEKEKKKQALLCRERGALLLEDVIKCCDGKSNPIKFFSPDLILKATNNFSNSNRVFEIHSYPLNWYSGVNDNSRRILMKRYVATSYFDLDSDFGRKKYKSNKKFMKLVGCCLCYKDPLMVHNFGEKKQHSLIDLDLDFCRDLAISSMVSGHKNFMKLLGCCLELEYPLLVYSSEQYSSIDIKNIVSWKRRMKIAEDIATALAYLHTAFTTPFVYRNMSIDNILIDNDGVAKLSDFSGCISIPQGKTFVTVNRVTGTIGYIDRDYAMNNTVSEKTDAFGFGICMMLLIIGGRKRFYDFAGEDLLNPWLVSKFIEKGRLVDEIADPKMLENMGEVTEEERRRMNAFILLSLRCCGCNGEVPTMVEVAKELKKIQRSSQNAASSSSSSS